MRRRIWARRFGGGVGEERGEEWGEERRQETGGTGKESILNFKMKFTFLEGAVGGGWGGRLEIQK